MPEMSEHPENAPCWVDLAAADIEVAKSFYSQLFGWTTEVMADPAAGGYTVFMKNGKAVAGGGPKTNPEAPSAWCSTICVSDADKTVQKAQEAGGSLIAGPMDVYDQGRLAVLADPIGAVIALWQPREMKGAQLVNEPGAWIWDELQSRDIAASEQFYTEVFGWTTKAFDSEAPMAYTMWELDGRSIGGMQEMPAMVPAEVPSYWLAYFAVEDCQGSLDIATGLGATVLVPATTIPIGTFSVLADPQGATFAIIATTPPS